MERQLFFCGVTLEGALFVMLIVFFEVGGVEFEEIIIIIGRVI